MPSTRSACDYLTLKNTRLVFFSSVVSVVSTFCCAIKLLFLTFFIQQYALKICPCCSLLGMYSARSAILTMNSASLPSSHPLPAQRGNLSCLLHTEGCNQGPFLWPHGVPRCVCVGWEVTEFRAPRHNVKRVATCPPARLRALGPPGSLSSPNISIPPLIFYKIPTLLFLHFPP